MDQVRTIFRFIGRYYDLPGRGTAWVARRPQKLT